MAVGDMARHGVPNIACSVPMTDLDAALTWGGDGSGNDLDNTLTGNAAADTLDGGASSRCRGVMERPW